MGRKKRPTLATRLQAERIVEEQLRPALPAHIPSNSTWLLAAQELMDASPEIYAGIVSRLADGEMPSAVARISRQPIEIIRKIRDLHPEVIEAGVQAAFSLTTEALLNAATRLANNTDELSINSLPVGVAVLIDKVQLIRGQATSRVEHKKVLSPEDIQAMFAALPEANATVVETKQ